MLKWLQLAFLKVFFPPATSSVQLRTEGKPSKLGRKDSSSGCDCTRWYSTPIQQQYCSIILATLHGE